MPQQSSGMDLYQFQKEAIEKFLENGSQIIALPTGTGKTVVAITIIRKLLEKYGSQFRCLVIVPANLRSNFTDNILKFHLNLSNSIITSAKEFHDIYEKSNVLVISYNFLRLHIKEVLSYNYDLVICDEIHYAKNRGSATFKSLFMLRKNVKHFVGLTASPISNNAQEFFTIVALVANDISIINRGMQLVKYTRIGAEKQSLISQWLFGKKKRLKKGTLVQIGISDPYSFKHLVGRWIYIPVPQKISATGKRPDIRSKVVKIPLTHSEVLVYEYVLGKIPKFLLRQLESGTISDNDVRQIKNWLIAAQQVLLSPDYILQAEGHPVTNPQPSSKVKAVGNMLKMSGEKSIVFTPFLNYGAKVANAYFNHIGIRSEEYSGSIKKDDRRKIVNQFENGDLQVICLTGAGQEGINLPSCKNIFFLSMHFNPEVMRQVMGRALRITSKNKFVQIYFMFSVIKKIFRYVDTVDQWMSQIVNRKSLLRQEIFRILQENQEL